MSRTGALSEEGESWCASFLPRHKWRRPEVHSSQAVSGLPPRTQACWRYALGFPTSDTVRNAFPLFISCSVSGGFLLKPSELSQQAGLNS